MKSYRHRYGLVTILELDTTFEIIPRYGISGKSFSLILRSALQSL